MQQPTRERTRIVTWEDPLESASRGLPLGFVHGGLAATLLDSATGCAIQTTLPAGYGYTTLELKTFRAPHHP